MSRRRFQPRADHPRCTLGHRKLRYKSQQAAERILAQVIVHGSYMQAPRRAYKCEACGGWHLTSEEKR